jgi:ABC-type transport system involved in multi-copper enzyme maturation permease subunit
MYLLLTKGSGPDRELAGIFCGFQFAIGLLLASVTSATSLAEERARGSLDVLLATPLSTREILWGKWCGAYREVIPLSLLPGLFAFVGCQADRWMGPPLVVGLGLACGAAITSLGLALATGIRQVGRVVALSVGIYAGISIAWPALVLLLASRGTDDAIAFATMGTPFFGITFGVLGSTMQGGPDFGLVLVPAAILWILILSCVAAGLLVATLGTFDRCLGRIPERPLEWPARVRHKPASPKPTGVLEDQVLVKHQRHAPEAGEGRWHSAAAWGRSMPSSG